MRFFILAGVFFYISINALAQDHLMSPEFNKFWQNVKQIELIEGKDDVAYKGSPYLFENDHAALELNNGQVVNELTIRYNVYNDEMEIKKGEHYYTIPKEKLFPRITLGEHHFYLKVYKASGSKQNGYFESVVNDSLCSLFIRHNIFLQPASEPKAYQDAKPATFKSKPVDLYISFNNEVLLPVKNKNDFIDLAPHHQKTLATYIKKNKIKFKKAESVKLLVQYYHSLFRN